MRHRQCQNIRDSIRARGGVARTHELLQIHPRAEVRRSVNNGEIVRMRKGVYALSSEGAVSHAAAHGGALTCLSLLREHGVWVLSNDPRTHVDLGRGGRQHTHPECACRMHYSPTHTRLAPATVADALLIAANCLSAEAFFAAFESAWNRRLLTGANREWIRQHVPARFRRLLSYARGDAESGLESLIRLRLTLLGISVETQVTIPTVGRVDLLIGNLIIEADGTTGHTDTESRKKDLRRDRAAAALGYQTLRVTYAMVVHEWPETLRAILTAAGRA